MQTMTVTIDKTAVSATVRDDGYTELLYNRIIADQETGEVIVRDVVSEMALTHKVAAEVEKLIAEKAHAKQAP